MNHASTLLLIAAVVCAPFAHGQSIYTCTDAKGRKITSDRPIAECLDRDQTELNDSGMVKRIVKPTMTAVERAAYEEKINQELSEQNRRSEERRKNRALVARYPNQTAHDRERKDALSSLDAATASAQTRLTNLRTQSKKLDEEMEFYKKDPSKAPPRLKQQINDNKASIEAQLRFLEGQKEEAKRINTRFDRELEKLNELWGAAPTVPASAPAAANSQTRK